MTWDYPPTTAGKRRYWNPPTASVQISGGPDRVSLDAPKDAPKKRYVGFVKPSEDETEEPESDGTIPGVW